MIKKILFTTLVIIFAVLLAVAGVGYFLVYQPAMGIKEKANKLKVQAAEMREIAKQNDLDLITAKTAELRKTFDEIKADSHAFDKFTFIPHVRDYFAALNAGDSLFSAAEEAIVAIAPVSDLIGFKKGKSSLAEKSTEERLETAVLTLDSIMSKIDPISTDVAKAKASIDSIDPARYPVELRGIKVREMISQGKDQFDGAYRLIVNAQPFLKELPRILGKTAKQRYLIIFQNDKERRATGGFWTGTTELSMEKGKFEFAKVTNIYDIDSGVKPGVAPDPIKRYFKGVSQWYLRDSNISPDLVESVKNFQSLYKTYGSAVEYDGIFFIDTKILVDLITIFGEDVTEKGVVVGKARYVDGVQFSTKIDPRCDCPQVIYTLLESIGTQVGYAREDRKAILGSLLKDLTRFAIGASPKLYWGRTIQSMLQNMDEKHILMTFKYPSTQAAIEKMGWAGRITDAAGTDYLHINNVNFGGQKSNLFVKESVVSKTEGSKRTVTITFKNPFPGSNCNLEQKAVLCLNAPLRNWIRFYVPKGSTLGKLSGSSTETRTYDELGKTVYEGFLIVNPEGRAEVTVEYTLPTGIDSTKLAIQKQAGLTDQTWKVDISGKKVFDGVLAQDVTVQ